MPNIRASFGELIQAGALEIGDGYRAKNSELNGNGLPFMRAGNLTASGWNWEDLERFRSDLTSALAPKLSHAGDVVITTKGNSVGRSGYVNSKAPQFVYSPHLSFWRAKQRDRLAPRFLRYWAMSPEFLDQLKALGHGTDMAPYLSLTDQRRLRVSLPRIEAQETIGELLGALDDKIAVNDRIAECSLTLADAHFNLAVEGVPIGPETFDSIAQVGGGGTPSTKVPEYWDGNITWTTPSDVTALGAPYLFDTSRRITSAGLENCASPLYPAGSIFMTSRATIGAFAIPQVPMAANQGFIVVVTPDKELTTWLFHEMRDRVDEMRRLANGSTFLELSRKNFKAMGVRLSTSTALKEFARKAIPLHQLAAAVTAESATLIKLRDTLLPELMSGRLRVKDVEKVVEEAI
ncbi:restriction endonuclease subunit S [Salinispora arenicola]|uniref:restriction endonuclease subunit S n=1 Tax=Salinispora arenicola TaxID=168697 RepID=UPI0018AD341B|nr:restriction endonuclease subunit S [Salinispora arenicola]